MSITNYGELKAAVANWLGNAEKVQRVPELISLFEAKIKRTLRVRQMESRSTASTVGGQAALALPTDFLEMRNLKLNTNPVTTLQVQSPHNAATIYGSTTTNKPKLYKIVGSEIIFYPIPDAVYTVELDYYSFTALSDSNTTNWLLTAYPDAYLDGSLYQVGPGDPRYEEWKYACEQILQELRDADKGARWNGSPLVARPNFVTP